MRRWFVFLPLVLLTACAGAVTKMPKVETAAMYEEAKKQRALMVKEYVDSYDRVQRIGFPILVANHDLCGENVTYLTGMHFSNANRWKGEMRETMIDLRDLDEFIKIVYVIPNSPAAKAGLKRGDTLITINEKQVPYGDDAVEKFARQLGKIQTTGDTITLAIRRNDKPQTIAIKPVKACAYPIEVDPDSTDNAFATGEKVVFHQGLLRAADDQAVALIMGHEIAHNVMRHPQKGMQNARTGGILGLIVSGVTGVNVVDSFQNIGQGMNSQDFEAEADYVGVYMMARAGFDLTDVADAWRKRGIRNPGSISHGSSHPPSAARFIAVEKAVAEIGVKRSKGQKLIPNDFDKMRDDAPAADTDETSN